MPFRISAVANLLEQRLKYVNKIRYSNDKTAILLKSCPRKIRIQLQPAQQETALVCVTRKPDQTTQTELVPWFKNIINCKLYMFFFF